MDGILSQDEINALLSGMDLSDPVPAESSAPVSSSAQEDLSEIEKDAIGEIANISMGTSATTLYSLVNRKVNITTPKVEISTWDDLVRDYQRPCVFIQIRYTSGLDGSNILILREHDVKVITDLMMGGDGTNVEGELGELHLSAISEAMNQMMGSSATSLSSMLGKVVDISPPEASLVDLSEFKKAEDIASFLTGKFAKISFRMQIGDLVDSTIMQLYPISFAREMCAGVTKTMEIDNQSVVSDSAPTAASEPAFRSPLRQVVPSHLTRLTPEETSKTPFVRSGVELRSNASAKPVTNSLPNTGGFQIGSRVRHERFGEGKVLAMEGEGGNLKITVAFSMVGQKQLLAKFARLTLLDS